jgi:hypothetical protein
MKPALLALLLAVACGSASTATPVAAPTPHALLKASGVVANKKQYSFEVKSSPWTLNWAYTCFPTSDPAALCDLIVAVYGPDGKLADEITPSPWGSARSGSQDEKLGTGTFYVWVSSDGTSSWSVDVQGK